MNLDTLKIFAQQIDAASAYYQSLGLSVVAQHLPSSATLPDGCWRWSVDGWTVHLAKIAAPNEPGVELDVLCLAHEDAKASPGTIPLPLAGSYHAADIPVYFLALFCVLRGTEMIRRHELAEKRARMAHHVCATIAQQCETLAKQEEGYLHANNALPVGSIHLVEAFTRITGQKPPETITAPPTPSRIILN